jgi:membrane dipeptidase
MPGMIPVIDGHNDALTRDDHAQLASGRDGGDLDVMKMRTGGIRGAIFAVFTASDGEREEPLPRSDGVIEFELAPPIEHPRAAADAARAAARLLALERGGHVRVARRIDDIDRALDIGDQSGPDPTLSPPAAILHLEGAEAIDPGLEALDFWYAAGLRSIGPVWSRPNAFGHGVPFIFPSSPDTGPGLTDAGRALVRRCAELGILIDLSHLNEAGFWDVAALEPGPLVASHSGVHALCAASRNLTDAQLDAIGASGGLVGIVFACQFLRADFSEDTDTPIALIAQHARYVADRIGVEHVALGSDFDGAPIPADLGDAAGMQRVLRELDDAGFGSKEIEAIAWRNWRRVLADWWRS